jgi:osmoprotectant transport system permease protein
VSLIDFMSGQSDRLLESTLQSLRLIAIVALVATFLSVSVGLLTYRHKRLSRAALSVFSVFLTIPSFALFGIFIPIFGLGFTPAVIALVMYSMLPITRNTIVGLQAVDPAVVDAARGMGMSRNRILLRTELPLAWPVVLTGVRVAVQIVVGISAIASFIGVEGLGDFIFRGLSNIGTVNALNFALAGTVLLVLLALVLDVLLVLISKLTTPRGIRA